MAPGSRSPRAEHAARTRQALVDAALELFASQGYDTTTTDEIAEAAGVSPRTFFRYFPTKESVLFFGEYDFIRSFTGVFLAQPEDVPELDAMSAAFVVLAPGVARLRERTKLYEKAIASSLLLRGREQVAQEDNIATMAAAVAHRRGLRRPDDDCVLLASLGLLVMRRALEAWLRGPARADLGERIIAGFEQLAQMVHPAPLRAGVSGTRRS
jgi:AcrR family transcriptional regulator